MSEPTGSTGPIELTYHHDGFGLTELCRVFVLDEPHPVNGAHHDYLLQRELSTVEREDDDLLWVGFIQFQRGPRDVEGSTPGTLDGAVLSVLIHRQECFQAGPFACAENEQVLHHLREALRLTIQRAKDRAARQVLGKNEK